jgi:hypothetical protein
VTIDMPELNSPSTTTHVRTERKTSLTPEEKVKAYYLNVIRGWDQQDIAFAFEVNIGRVNEAIADIRDAVK